MRPSRATEPSTDERAPRPFAFLVSTTRHARTIRNNLGSAAYSYYFVLEALAPALERLGTWQRIDHPESRLPFVAARAEAEGFRPVHLILNPPQDAYLAPEIPNILFPFWEFPDIPDRDFALDSRQNWARLARHADLIVTACRFTADAFRRPDLDRTVAVVPVPVAPACADIPTWSGDHAWTWTGRHEVWGGRAEESLPATEPPPIAVPRPTTVKGRAWGVARATFRRVAPRLNPETVARLCRAKQTLAGKSPGAVAYLAARGLYKRTIRRLLSDRAIHRITDAKVAGLRRLGLSQADVLDPLLPSRPLTLDGLVFTSFANVGDERKNLRDLLTGFLIAFRDRPNVTLVLKLASSPHREHHEMTVLSELYGSLGIEHACRVVIVTEFLDDDQMAGLLRATTYYVNTSHAEGACLPLQQALAAGRPAIAPAHTAMADYMDDAVGFVVRSFPEPTHWPHDPEMRIETTRHRLVWADLRDAFLAAAEVVRSDPARYADMSEAARRRMAGFASVETAVEALSRALAMLPDGKQRRLARSG